VRAGCEYSTDVEASSETEALQLANELPKVEWDQAWSQDEVIELDEEGREKE
jgi:hypothetical protein